MSRWSRIVLPSWNAHRVRSKLHPQKLPITSFTFSLLPTSSLRIGETEGLSPIIGCPCMTEPSENIQQMSIGVDGRNELVIMIMQDSLQRIGLQHKRLGTSPHHIEKGAPIVVTKIGRVCGGLQLEKDETRVKHRFRILNEPAEWPAAQMSVAGGAGFQTAFEKECIHTGEIGFRIIKCMQHPQISFPQSVAAHAEGNDVRSVRRPIGGFEPILAGKPCIEWCLGDRGKHADRGMDHTGLLDETDLPIENVQAVMVETDDHTTPDLEPVGLDGVHLFYQAALLTAQVLQLTRFTQRFLVGGFNADKDVTDICIVHEAHEFFIVCQIERSLRKKCHRIIMRLLPGDDFAENVFYRLLIADQIVINDEDATDPT